MRPRGLVLLALSASIGGGAALGCLGKHAPVGGDPSPESASSAHPGFAAPEVAADAEVASTAMQSWVFDRPDRTAKKLGYLRLGAHVARSREPVAGKGCSGAWYRVDAAGAGAGFVCVAEPSKPHGEFSLDLAHPVIRALARAPDLKKPMPYPYAFVRANTPLYMQLPTIADQTKLEFGVKKHLGVYARHRATWNDVDHGGANEVPLDEHGVAETPIEAFPPDAPRLSDHDLFGGSLPGSSADEPPWWLHVKPANKDGTRFDRDVPNVSPFVSPAYAMKAGKVERHAGLALLGTFVSGPESGDRRFAVTLDGRLVPTDKLKPHYASSFHGVVIDGVEVKVPFAIVRKIMAFAYKSRETGGAWEKLDPLTYRSIVPLTGKERKFTTHRYLEAVDGRWLSTDEVAYVGDPNEWPTEFDFKKTKWLDVSIWNQAIVAYEGDKAVYATLVSTGIDGMGDPHTSKSTVRGAFRIDSKHVTTTMDADDVENHFELRDVPWVQYFEGSYALHATYWHDDFGKPRSHGCINLAPIDAHWLFFWTDPPLPNGWHGVRSRGDLVQGTWVRVHG